MLKHHSINLSTTSETTNVSRLKKSIKDPIVDLKKKLNKTKHEKINLLLAHEDKDNSFQYHFDKYNENKHSYKRNGYLAYNKFKRLNTKTRNIFDHLKNTYDITVGTNHPQCAEPSDPIVKCENFNRRSIQNCTSVYQMQLYTVRFSLIISRRPFEFTKGSRSSDQIDYLL